MKTKFLKFKIFFIILFTIGFVVDGVFITIYNVDKSSNIGIVSEDITTLKMKNNKLTEDISKMDSLTGFFDKSKREGFGIAGNILYFNSSGTVAQAR